VPVKLPLSAPGDPALPVGRVFPAMLDFGYDITESTRMPSKKTVTTNSKLDRVVADARRERVQRERGYREKSLKMYPWICGRCGREFTRENLHELTVHHRDHDHDNNPPTAATGSCCVCTVTTTNTSARSKRRRRAAA